MKILPFKSRHCPGTRQVAVASTFLGTTIVERSGTQLLFCPDLHVSADAAPARKKPTATKLPISSDTFRMKVPKKLIPNLMLLHCTGSQAVRCRATLLRVATRWQLAGKQARIEPLKLSIAPLLHRALQRCVVASQRLASDVDPKTGSMIRRGSSSYCVAARFKSMADG